jgi:hypothetical protein
MPKGRRSNIDLLMDHLEPTRSPNRGLELDRTCPVCHAEDALVLIYEQLHAAAGPITVRISAEGFLQDVSLGEIVADGPPTYRGLRCPQCGQWATEGERATRRYIKEHTA